MIWITAFAGMTRWGQLGVLGQWGVWLEVIEFGVFVAEVLDVGGDGEGLAGGLLDEFVGGEGGAVAVDVLL